MEISRHNRCISEACNEIIGVSWSRLQIPIPETDGRQYPILQYGIEDMDLHYNVKEVNSLRHTPIPGHDPMIEEASTTWKRTVDLGPYTYVDRTEYLGGAGDHEAVMKILSSPLFNAFSSDAGFLSSGDASAVAKIRKRLAQVRPSSKLDSAELAEELFKRTTSDEWLCHYIQSEDFDGTWVDLICGFYQSLYLYHTQTVENHHISGSRDNHSLASNQKIVVLLLRLQHLRTFQRIVACKLPRGSLPQVFELLGSQEFLYSCLMDSLQETMNDLRKWEKYMLYGMERNPFRNSGSLNCWVYLLPTLLDIEDDIWLWKHLHYLDETSDTDNVRCTIIASLYQGLYLYGKDKNHTETKEMAEGRLAALLFRSHHSEHIAAVLFPDSFPLILRLSESLVSMVLDERLFLDASEYIIFFARESYYSFLQGRSLEMSLSKKEKKEAYGIEDSSFSHGSINTFLGTQFVQGFHSFSPTVEEPIDLKQVHALGGLICTIEGEPSTSSSGDDLACTSWCIVRHPATNLFFCVDLKEDDYENKIHLLDGESTIDYEGAIEVEITDGNTFVRSLESDGSSYNGCLGDFVDSRGDKKAPTSCAEVALRNLPQSDRLKNANLKCSTLHMLALAFSAGNKDCLRLKWEDGAGHIEYSTSLNGQDEGPTDVALRKCTLVYTNEGKLVGEDIIWEGDGLQRSTNPQDSLHGENKEEETNGEEVMEEESDKIDIILEQSKLWMGSGLMGDLRTVGPDRSSVRASLIRARKEAEGELVSDERASVLVQSKQNTGFAFGFATVKVEGSHDHRNREANTTIKRYQQELILVRHLKSTVVVPGDLHTDDFNNLKVLLTSGRIKQHPREFFIVKAKGSCSLQVFFCNLQDPSQAFTWLTDVVLPNATDAETVFRDKLNGKTLSISRTDSELYIRNDLAQNAMIRPIQKILGKHQKPLIDDKSMISGSDLKSMEVHSGDSWKFVVGDQSKYSRGDYFFKATEYQAIVCSATIYTTGGAIVRLKKEIPDRRQTATSANSRACEQLKWLVHGSCKKVCTPKFEIETDEETLTGKFSNFKGISQWPDVYWG